MSRVSASVILIHDSTTGEPMRIASDSSLLLVSPEHDSGLLFEHQRLPPTQTPDVHMEQHLLSVQLRPPEVLESRQDGGPRAWRLNPGDVWFVPAGSTGRYSWREPTEALNLALDPPFVEQIAGGDRLDWVGPRGGPDPVVRHLAWAVRAEIAAGLPGGRLLMTSLATALAAQAITRYSVGRPGGAAVARALRRHELGRVADYVQTYIAADLSLAELAAVVHLSPYHFARCFKTATGLTPHRYVLRCRLERARALLAAQPALTVEQIARRTGFASGSHLARHVRRLTGAPPRRKRVP